MPRRADRGMLRLCGQGLFAATRSQGGPLQHRRHKMWQATYRGRTHAWRARTPTLPLTILGCAFVPLIAAALVCCVLWCIIEAALFLAAITSCSTETGFAAFFAKTFVPASSCKAVARTVDFTCGKTESEEKRSRGCRAFVGTTLAIEQASRHRKCLHAKHCPPSTDITQMSLTMLDLSCRSCAGSSDSSFLRSAGVKLSTCCLMY